MTIPADFTAILAHWEASAPDAVAITFGGTQPDLGRAGRSACGAPPRRSARRASRPATASRCSTSTIRRASS